jgi:hypothetical protein
MTEGLSTSILTILGSELCKTDDHSNHKDQCGNVLEILFENCVISRNLCFTLSVTWSTKIDIDYERCKQISSSRTLRNEKEGIISNTWTSGMT